METYGLRGRPVVVLDTNMFLVPYQFRVDVIEEIERLLPGAEVTTIPQVVKELEKIEKEGKLNDRLGARIGMILLKRVKIIEAPQGPTDAALLQLAREGYIIATNDKELRRKIREIGGTSIFLRERNHLEME